MKPLIWTLTVLLAWPAILFAQGYPTVDIQYGYAPFDRSCEQFTGTQIEREWIEELQTRLGEFQAAWDTQGASLLEATVAEIGKPFRQHDVIATLTLCEPVGSMSSPLLINVRRYLVAAAGDDARPMWRFVHILFHEVLHHFTSDVIIARRDAGVITPLMTKYEDEPFRVKAHLFLMALMKEVYLNLGRTDELNQLTRYSGQRGDYGRAWEIVNDLEGHEAFVEDLKR